MSIGNLGVDENQRISAEVNLVLKFLVGDLNFRLLILSRRISESRKIVPTLSLMTSQRMLSAGTESLFRLFCE